MKEKFSKKLILKLVIREILKTKINNLRQNQIIQEPVKQIIKTQPLPTQKRSTKIYSKELSNIKFNPQIKPLQKKIIYNQNLPPLLRIPEPRFPPHLQRITPVLNKWELELGKINNLTKNPNTKLIECNGEDKPLIVSDPNRKITNIILTKEEIEKIIKIFSEVSRIPVQEGINKIVIGDLILTTIISKTASTKFLIKKLRYPQNNLNLSSNQKINYPTRPLY